MGREQLIAQENYYLREGGLDDSRGRYLGLEQSPPKKVCLEVMPARQSTVRFFKTGGGNAIISPDSGCR